MATNEANTLMPAEADLISLPAIDMSAPEEQIVPQIMEMCETLGFFHLKNVPGFDEDILKQDLREFHDLPDIVKHRLSQKTYNAENSNRYRGYVPFIDNDPSHKEMFDMGCDTATMSEEESRYPLTEATPFPAEPEYAQIEQNFRHHYEFRLRLSLKLLEYIALGLSKERHFFQAWFDESSLSTFRSIRYLPRQQSTVRSDSLQAAEYRLTTPEHTDSGFLTLLTTFGYPGLQIPIDGEYKFVKPEKNNFVVNLGNIFERVTNYRLKATMHRVMDIGCERYSSPFFFEPKSSAVIPSNILNSAEDQVDEPIVYGRWLAQSMKRFGEWKNFELADGEPTSAEVAAQ